MGLASGSAWIAHFFTLEMVCSAKLSPPSVAVLQDVPVIQAASDGSSTISFLQPLLVDQNS